MLYSYLFRSRWAALFWVASILVGVYLRTPRAADSDPQQSQEQAKPVNPWAKDK